MKSKLVTFFACVVACLVACGPTAAHHGSSISYDMTKPVTLKGTVTEFVWSNPHCAIFFDVKDEKGKVVNWGGETNSPGVLARDGWNKTIIKPGDQITITVFPSKAGTPVGLVSKVVLSNGKELVRRNPAQ